MSARAGLAALALAVATPTAAQVTAPALLTRTMRVNALADDGDTLWVATSGGLERYDLARLARIRLFTRLDGLADNDVRAVESRGGTIHVRTARATCTLAGERFACAPAAEAPIAAPGTQAVRILAGSRVTAERGVGGRVFVGTATAGVWLDGASPRRLTPDDQICSNEIVATERFAGRLWFASFDEGLCSYDGHRFRRARLPADMMNDLVATPDALFAASTRGLFRTRDGQRWQRVGAFDNAGVVDLAFDGHTVWAVTPGALWEIPVGRRGTVRRHGEPGGARALQAVDVRGGRVWLASEDRGALRMAGQRFEIFDRAAGLPTSWAVDVAATPDGGAYVATLRHGLVRIEPDGRSRVVAARAIDPWMLHVRFDQATGGLWVGTQSGAAWLTAGGEPSPLPVAAQVHAILPTAAGVWLSTDRGTALVPLARSGGDGLNETCRPPSPRAGGAGPVDHVDQSSRVCRGCGAASASLSR